MARTALCLCVVLALLAWPLPAASQTAVTDPEVLQGIRQVDEGDYDAAILTLDTAARRLAGSPARTKDLSQAYLYLGIAYLAKGHETSARARFRDALAQMKTLTLTPDKFAPRVIEVFEKAREDEREAGGPAGSGAAGKKGGSKKGLIIVGVGAVAAGGAALALSGGGGNSVDEAFGVLLQNSFSGLLFEQSRFFDVQVQAAGTLSVTVDWQSPDHDVDIYLTPLSCNDTSHYPPDVCQVLARSEQGDKPERFTSAVNPGPYRVVVRWCCGEGDSESGTIQAILSP